MKLCSALPFISKALRYGPCVTMESHSFTCHPHTNHTCLYSPVAGRHRPAAGTHCALPTKGWPGLVNLGGWLHTEVNVPHQELNPDKFPHPGTNRARRKLTNSLIETNMPPLRQTTTRFVFEVIYCVSSATFTDFFIHCVSKKCAAKLLQLTFAIIVDRF